MLSGRAAELAPMLESVLVEAGFAVQVPVIGPLMGLFFTDRPVTDYDEAKAACVNGVYPALFHAMPRRGGALAPGPYQVLFPSLAPSRGDPERTAAPAPAALAA